MIDEKNTFGLLKKQISFDMGYLIALGSEYKEWKKFHSREKTLISREIENKLITIY